MSFSGSCHCGKISFTVDEPLPSAAVACNCSICRRKGALHHFTSPDKVERRGMEHAATYTFNRHRVRHLFCATCGCSPFAEGEGPNGPGVVVNLRCVDDVDPDTLTIRNFDGASL